MTVCENRKVYWAGWISSESFIVTQYEEASANIITIARIINRGKFMKIVDLRQFRFPDVRAVKFSALPRKIYLWTLKIKETVIEGGYYRAKAITLYFWYHNDKCYYFILIHC